MTKTITTILVALFAVACGGEPFTGPAFEAIGGEPAVGTAGASAPAAGGSTGSGGIDAGGEAGAGGEPTAGSNAVGGTGTGGEAPACALSATRLSQTLPGAFSWKDFSIAQGNVCASCAYEPCSKLGVAWGAPVVQGDTVTYSPTYTPNASVAPLVRVTHNDGTCSGGSQCEVKPATVSVKLSVARDGGGWKISTATVSATFADDDCTLSVGTPGELTVPMARDLEQEIRGSLIGLKFPCN